LSYLDSKLILRENSKKCSLCKVGNLKCIKKNFAFSSVKSKLIIGGKVWSRPLIKKYKYIDDYSTRSAHGVRRPHTNVPVYSMYFYCSSCGNVQSYETLASDLRVIDS
jgi:hypothetical protein